MSGCYFARLLSSIAPVTVVIDSSGALKQLTFREITESDEMTLDHARCSDAVRQLREYFQKKRTVFDLPLAPEGTAFQQRVWGALRAIPFGETTSYLQLAQKLGDAKAIRAVGRANGANPIAIVIPCHRVIGSDGSLVGYGGGLSVKSALLEHEGALPRGQQAALF